MKTTMKSGRKIVDETMNQPVIYGGIPVRYSTVVRHLDAVAATYHPKDKSAAFKLREAGLMGFMQYERAHPANLPDDVDPLTYEEFEIVANLAPDEKVPAGILRKWETMFPKAERERRTKMLAGALGSSKKPPAPRAKSKRTKRSSKVTTGMRGLR